METLTDACNRIRKEIEAIKPHVLNLKTGTKKGEVIANIMLSYRHLEDARMRLGKALQADGDGVSIYDKGESKSGS